MIKRLMENDIALNNGNPSDDNIEWWLRESRTPEHLMQLTERYPDIVKKMISQRPLLVHAAQEDLTGLSKALEKEKESERDKDIEYWRSLRKELETLRHNKKK